jgi:hypothetical protein
MTNVEVTQNGHLLTLVIDLSQRNGRSASGKTEIIASTNGNQKLTGEYGKVAFGVNVYAKP